MAKAKLIVSAIALTIPNCAYASEDWSGAYAGIYLDGSTEQTDFEDLQCWTSCTEPSLQGTTPSLGVTIGYDIETNRGLVLGVAVEAGSGTKLAADNTTSGLNPTGSTHWQTEIDFQYAARARLGVTTGNSLVYVFGGASFANANISAIGRDYPVSVWWPTHGANFEATWKGTLKGTNYGLGIEHKLGQVSIKAEFGMTKYSPVQSCFANSDGPSAGTCWTSAAPIPAQMQNFHSESGGRVGINYRF